MPIRISHPSFLINYTYQLCWCCHFQRPCNCRNLNSFRNLKPLDLSDLAHHQNFIQIIFQCICQSSIRTPTTAPHIWRSLLQIFVWFGPHHESPWLEIICSSITTSLPPHITTYYSKWRSYWCVSHIVCFVWALPHIVVHENDTCTINWWWHAYQSYIFVHDGISCLVAPHIIMNNDNMCVWS